MKRIIFAILLMFSLIARAADKPYRVSINITPPEGAVYTEVTQGITTYYEWQINGQRVMPYWSVVFPDAEMGDPNNGYEYGYPLSYGQNTFMPTSNDDTRLALDADNFPLRIMSQPKTDEYGSQLADKGGVLAGGVYYPFGDDWSITISEPGNYDFVGVFETPTPGSLKITADCPIFYSIGTPEKKELLSGSVIESVYPDAEVRIYPGSGVKFYRAHFTAPGSSDKYSLKNEGEYLSYRLPSVDMFSTSGLYQISAERERMQFTVVSNVSDAVSKNRLDVVGATYNGDGKFSISKADSISLRCSLLYRIESITDKATGLPLEYDPTTYVVKGVTAGMVLNVTLREVAHDKTINFAFYNIPAMDGNVTVRLAAGSGRQTDVAVNPKSNALQQISFADEDLPIVLKGAKFTHDGQTYKSAVFLNNVQATMDEDGLVVWPGDLADGSVVRIVNAPPMTVTTRKVNVNLAEGMDLNLMVDKRNVGPAQGTYTLPVGAYINLIANPGNVYAYSATYSTNTATGVISATSDFRLERGYTTSVIEVEKANARSLMVYVEESDLIPAEALTIGKGLSTEKTIELSQGYQPLEIALEDLPLSLMAGGGDESVAVYLNNAPIDLTNGVCTFPETLADNSVVKIFANRPSGVPAANVKYDFSSLKDFDVVLTHDNVPSAVDPSLSHLLLPGTEIRFTIESKELTAADAKIHAMSRPAAVAVKVNSAPIAAEADGSYLVKVNDDHIAGGLNIEVAQDLAPASIEEIVGQSRRSDIYSINGVLICRDADLRNLGSLLPAGLYVVSGRVIAIR